MFEFSVDPALLLAVVAGGLAIAFEYFPGLAGWFEGLSETQKKQLNLGLVAAVAVALFVGDCYGLFLTNLQCTVVGAVELVGWVFVAVGINQGVHLGTKRSKVYVEVSFPEG